MCGIFGSINFDPDITIVKSNLHLRGPDQFSQYKVDNVLLCQSRLIINGSNSIGKQPHISDSGNVIIFNGEIYSFYGQHIRDLAPKCEIELLGELYDKYGIECLDKIDGMFSVAIYDAKSHIIHLARDLFGQKPLYYYRHGNFFLFSSSQVLLKQTLGKLPLDYLSISHFLTYGCAYPYSGIWLGVNQVRNGHVLSIHCESLNISSHSLNPLPYADANDFSLVELLKSAVEYASHSTVDISVLLSGGVDSSLLCYFAAQKFSSLAAVTIAFADVDSSIVDLEQSRIIAKKIGVSHFEYVLTSSDVSHLYDLYISRIDHPSNESLNSFIATYFASTHSPCTLSAQGLDELFYGYRHMQTNRPLKKRLFELYNTLKLIYRKPSPYTRYFLQRRLSVPRSIQQYQFPFAYARELLLQCHSPCYAQNDIIRSLEIQHYLVNHLMLDGDTASMSNSVELRPVFLTSYFIQNLIRNQREYGLNSKYSSPVKPLLSNLYKDLLDFSALPNKIGFELPLNSLNSARIKHFHELVNSDIWQLVFPTLPFSNNDFHLCRETWHIYILLNFLSIHH
jgi:asparagine synthase (glutamine-hydrolysing)